jgi:hypothetical protein
MIAGVEWPTAVPPGVDPATFGAHPNVERDRRLGIAPSRVIPDPKLPSVRRVGGCAKTGQSANELNVASLVSFYTVLCNQDSPIRKELPRLQYLAAHCGEGNVPGEVVEVVHQDHSSFALMAGAPKSFKAYYQQPDQRRIKLLEDMAPEGVVFEAFGGKPNELELPECDLLFLDVDPHTGAYYLDLLRQYAGQSRRYIAIHDSVVYGERFGNEPGLMYGVEAFVKEENGRWFIVRHYKDQNGLLILSRDWDDAQLLDGVDPETPKVEVVQHKSGEAVQPAPAEGPGTELKAIIASLGVEPSPTCDCNGRAVQMNIMGDDEVEKQEEIVAGWLSEGAERWSWAETIRVASRAVMQGLAFKLNPANPYLSLVREAVKRSREKKAQAVKS